MFDKWTCEKGIIFLSNLSTFQIDIHLNAVLGISWQQSFNCHLYLHVFRNTRTFIATNAIFRQMTSHTFTHISQFSDNFPNTPKIVYISFE